MAAPRRREPSAVAEAVTFWSIVIIISAVAAFISFRVGRDWLGKRLGDMQVSQGAPRIVAQAEMDAENALRIEQEKKAPSKAEPVIEDREPTAAEIRRVERDEGLEPQDGAELNTGSADEGDDPAERPDLPEDDPAAASEPMFTVTAGAFSDRAHALGLVSRLNGRGYSPYIQEITRDGKTLHRVCVARVRGRSDAEELQREVTQLGLTAGLVAGG